MFTYTICISLLEIMALMGTNAEETFCIVVWMSSCYLVIVSKHHWIGTDFEGAVLYKYIIVNHGDNFSPDPALIKLLCCSQVWDNSQASCWSNLWVRFDLSDVSEWF